MRSSSLMKDIELFLTNNKMSPYTFRFESIKMVAWFNDRDRANAYDQGWKYVSCVYEMLL
ncbi:hypothetical protein GCM10023261_07100 [Bartonella jaculi]|uniref:Uncharacterized protein n=1 Tax=Bartonella jaculi TaxID=686226 RepID=A0ABP9N0Z3_9HYPH